VSTRVVTVVILALTFLSLPFGGAALSDSDASFIVKGGWNSWWVTARNLARSVCESFSH
jgi:hypothetical protein